MFEIESMNVNSFPKTSFDRVLIIQISKILWGVSPPKTLIRGGEGEGGRGGGRVRFTAPPKPKLFLHSTFNAML